MTSPCTLTQLQIQTTIMAAPGSRSVVRKLTSPFTRGNFLSCFPQIIVKKRCVSSQQLYIDAVGDPKKVLKLRTQALPAIESRQVLVKTKLAPINPSDINMLEGTYFVQPTLPAVLGNEGVGEIIEVGSEVVGLQPGDWVIPADTAAGTWQTHRIAEDTEVLKVRNDIPAEAVATLSVNPCTAYRMLKDFIHLNPGDVVIQNGANSGVGVSVIQLAREWSITSVNIVRNRPDIDNLSSYLRSLGADYVVTEEFCRSPEMKKMLKGLPSQPKLAFNCIGGQSASELLRHLGQGGIMVTYGGMSKKPVIAPTGALLFKEIKLFGYWNTRWNQNNKYGIERFEMLANLSKLVKQSKFRAPECEYYNLTDFEQAIERSTSNFKGCKVVFKMD